MHLPGLFGGSGLMQSSALSQPGSAEPCSKSFEIFEVGLNGNDLASFADLTGEFQYEKSDVRSDIDNRRSGATNSFNRSTGPDSIQVL